MRCLARHAVCVLVLLSSVVSASAEGAWVLWVKSENLWVGHEDSPSGRVLGAFPTKDECLARMEQVMNQVATWNNGHGIPVTREGETLHLRIPSNPPRSATVTYSCVPNTS